MSDHHIIVVLGMHRSGTSALTRGLKVLGVHLGDDFIPDVVGVNDKGFWEDAEILQLNVELLASLGHDWHALLSPADRALMDDPVISLFMRRAAAILGNRLRGGDCFGMKDPRFPRLLPFWQEAFRRIGCRVSYIIASRNPFDVVRSLEKRDGIDPVKGYWLWYDHMMRSIRLTTDASRVVVSYHRLMENPAEQLDRMAKCLGLPFSVESELFDEYRTDFLDASLMHHSSGDHDLVADPNAHSVIKELSHLLDDLSRDNMPIHSTEVAISIDKLEQQFADIKPLLIRSASLEDQLAKERVRAAGLVADIQDRDRGLEDRNQHIASLVEKVDMFESSLSWRLTAPLRRIYDVLTS